ncbi:hypothetical protein [Rosistilla oblonga]|uniref:hypothetical protein n=1 Tax=Rosistilla oblonga TaxID=2527990 RepID=UPI003A969731
MTTAREPHEGVGKYRNCSGDANTPSGDRTASWWISQSFDQIDEGKIAIACHVNGLEAGEV